MNTVIVLKLFQLALPVDKSSAESVCSASIMSENVPCKVRKENVSQLQLKSRCLCFGSGYEHIPTIGILISKTEAEDKWRCDNSGVHALLPQVHTSLTAVK